MSQRHPGSRRQRSTNSPVSSTHRKVIQKVSDKTDEAIANSSANSSSKHLLTELSLPDRFETLSKRLGPEVAQILVQPPVDTTDNLERAAMAIKTRGEGLFIPVHGRSGTGKTTLAANLTHFLPTIFTQTQTHEGTVNYTALHETVLNFARNTNTKANDNRILPINIDHREHAPPSDTELAEIKRFLRNASKFPICPLIIWPDTKLENCESMARRYEGIAGASAIKLPIVFAGPDKRTWQDIAINTLRLANNFNSLEDLGVNPRDYEPSDFYSIGDFMRRIASDFDDKIFKLKKEMKRTVTLLVIFASESQEPGVLTQLASTSRYGLIDGKATVDATPESEIGKWWAKRRGLLTRAIVQLNAHVLSLPPSIGVGILRKYGSDIVSKILNKKYKAPPPAIGRLNQDMERTELGKFLASVPIKAYEARGTPAKNATAAFAAFAKGNLTSGKDKDLNRALGSAIKNYLLYHNIVIDRIETEKKLDFCEIIPDNSIYWRNGDVLCVEYTWRKGDFLVSSNRSDIAQYILEKLRAYVRQLGWTND